MHVPLNHNSVILLYTNYSDIKIAQLADVYLAIISSKSTGTPAAENTALTVDISSGPTPSPGIIVTL